MFRNVSHIKSNEGHSNVLTSKLESILNFSPHVFLRFVKNSIRSKHSETPFCSHRNSISRLFSFIFQHLFFRELDVDGYVSGEDPDFKPEKEMLDAASESDDTDDEDLNKVRTNGHQRYFFHLSVPQFSFLWFAVKTTHF